jgi:Pyruvate/2-oxoacid:ferredoxin oxidoreductase delta subunit
MRYELQARSRSDLTLPEVIGERCVHALIESAGCRACADACPKDAWVIAEDMLGIDTRRCDGCDLCVPACPQGAIAGRFHTSLLGTAQGAVAFAACAPSGVTDYKEGLMPCLHAIGMSDLLQVRRRGASLLVTCCGDCGNCARGEAKRLEQHLDATNRLLCSRELAPLEHRNLTPEAWINALLRARELAATRALDRRAFFHSAVEIPRKKVDALLEDATGSFVPPGLLLDGDVKGALFPFVPQFDARRCNGCDACVRLCPQGAVRLEARDTGAGSYRIDAGRCSGCGICADVCEQHAVAVASLAPSEQGWIPLQAGRCPVCGVGFHVPAQGEDQESLCWVCSRTDHHRILYQVLE